MRTLDQLYWDSRCTKTCGCKNLTEALSRHPELADLRGPQLAPGQTLEEFCDQYQKFS